MTVVASGSASIAYDVAGDGSGIALLHAGVADRRMWDGLFEELASAWRVVRLDLRGYGETPMAPGAFSHADDVAAVLADAGVEPAVMVGNSFGGLAALHTAIEHPDAVRGLVLLSSPLDEHEWSAEVRAFGAREDELLEAGEIDAAVELNVGMWSPGPAADLVRTMQRQAFELQLAGDAMRPAPEAAWPEPSVTARLGEISVPTLVVSGERDVADFAITGDRIADDVEGALRAVIPGAGHLLPLERPADMTALVSGFVTEIDQRA